MKYFLLLFVAYGPHAMDMFETEAKDKGSKYLLVKIEDKNEPVQYIEPKIFEERLPCQDKPWDRKWADYDFSILKEKVTHALKLIHLGMKKFIAATKNVQITSKKKAEK